MPSITTPYKNNTVSSVSGTTFTSNGTPFVAGDVGRCLVITSGTSIGRMRKIVSYTSTSVVEVDYAWNISPFANEKNAQTGVAFAEVAPSASDSWSMSHYLDDIDDGTGLVKDTNGIVYTQVGTNLLSLGTGVFLYDTEKILDADLGYVDITATAYVRFGDISSTGYTSAGCVITDRNVNWSPRRSWTNSTTGDAGDAHFYRCHFRSLPIGDVTAFSNSLWSFFRGQTAIYRMIDCTATGEFGMRIQGDESILLNFYASGGVNSAYNKFHPLPMGLVKNVEVVDSNGVCYWRVSDGNVVNVYNVEYKDIKDQLIYQTEAGTNALFNFNGFKLAQLQALPNIMNVTTADPDGALQFLNEITTSAVDIIGDLITTNCKRVIWDSAGTVVSDVIVSDGTWDTFYALYSNIPATTTGFKDLTDGTTTAPYYQAVMGENRSPQPLTEDLSTQSNKKAILLTNTGLTELNKAVRDAYTSITTPEKLFDRAFSWTYDNLDDAFPDRGELLIRAAGSQVEMDAIDLILDADAASTFVVSQTGAGSVTVNTNTGANITLVGATEAVANSDGITIAFPAGIQDNDVAYIGIGHSQSGENVWNTPSGWDIPTGLTEVQTGGTPASIPAISVFRRVLSSDSGSVPITNVGTNTSGIVAQMMVFRGVDTTTPEDATPTTATGASGDPNPASITTATNDAVILTFAIMDDGEQTTPTPPTGYTAINDTATLDGAGTGE